jgi:hypothetical protein
MWLPYYANGDPEVMVLTDIEKKHLSTIAFSVNHQAVGIDWNLGVRTVGHVMLHWWMVAVWMNRTDGLV